MLFAVKHLAGAKVWGTAWEFRGFFLPISTSSAGSREPDVTPVGQRHGLELAILRRRDKSVGSMILRADSEQLIHGVKIAPLNVYVDDRGSFSEVARLGEPGIAQNMVTDGGRQLQISSTLTYPGAIKAIHYHWRQTDLWIPVAGMLQVFLYDLRLASPTFGRINTVFTGVLQPWELLIPPGIGHGYKVLGLEPARLLYMTDRFYDPEEEGRLAYNDPDIAYDWETQHK